MLNIYSDLFLSHLCSNCVSTHLLLLLNAFSHSFVSSPLCSKYLPWPALTQQCLPTVESFVCACDSLQQKISTCYIIYSARLHWHVRLLIRRVCQCPCNQNLKDVRKSPSCQIILLAREFRIHLFLCFIVTTNNIYMQFLMSLACESVTGLLCLKYCSSRS